MASSHSRTLLGIFAKYWQPGQVKTRLAATIGDQRAAAIHRLFVESLLARFGNVADQRLIAFAPAAAERAFRELAGKAWQVAPQTTGDLGERMQHFFAAAMERAERVVLIGADSPDLPIEYIEQAFAALHAHDVVLGPAHDGGYYLVGAAGHVPPIFESVAWSTDRVWPQTLARLAAAGCRWHALPPWHDVDDHAGLTALIDRLVAAEADAAGYAALAAALQSCLAEIMRTQD